MATRPYKTTGCFRFVFFMMILAPLAYIGASYYNGQDGLQNIKNLFHKVTSVFGGNKSSQPSSTSVKTENPNPNQNSDHTIPVSSAATDESEWQSKLATKDKEINTLIQENLDLKSKLLECEKSKTPASPKKDVK